MPTFHERINKEIQGFEVSVYEIDNSESEGQEKLEEYLVKKLRNIKIYNDLDRFSELLNIPNIDSAYSEKLKNSIREICDPKKHQIRAFDVRRSFVTEFLSQLLLERQYNCVFYEEADKRINVDPIVIDKHSPGIDVTGIQINPDSLKFVVCEVKASKSDIPCTESDALLEDIKRAHDIKNKRLTREILSYCQKLEYSNDETFIKVVEFLIQILANEQELDFVLNNIVFFPFLIRQNSNIITSSDIRDYEVFSNEDFTGSSIKGIIWSFNDDISSFCENIWTNALVDA